MLRLLEGGIDGRWQLGLSDVCYLSLKKEKKKKKKISLVAWCVLFLARYSILGMNFRSFASQSDKLPKFVSF